MKWYMRLASRFMRATELQMITKPWRRSALWKEVRFDGVDFVRLWRKGPLCDRDCIRRGCPRAVPFVPFLARVDGARWRTSPCDPLWVVAGLFMLPSWRDSLALLRLRDSPSVLREPSKLGLRVKPRPLRPRSHKRPSPSQTKPISHRVSFPAIYAHHLKSTPKAMQKRMGRMVKVHSHASRHARAPNMRVFSRNMGRKRKFFSRSNLTALDS